MSGENMPMAEIMALAEAIGVKLDAEKIDRLIFEFGQHDIPRCDVSYVGEIKKQ